MEKIARFEQEILALGEDIETLEKKRIEFQKQYESLLGKDDAKASRGGQSY